MSDDEDSEGDQDGKKKDQLAYTMQNIRPAHNLDYTTAEIKALPKTRPRLTSRFSARFTNVAKALHIFKDRKKKRVDENHKLYLTAHCIRDAIKYTTMQRFNDAEKVEIKDPAFSFVKRTTLPVTATHRESITEGKSSTFQALSSLSIGSIQSDNVLVGNKQFEFKEYAPDVFLKLRHHFGISQEAYMKSLASEDLYLDFQTNSKSGQFFFFSDDRFFMIKTLTQQEVLWLMNCLSQYYEHFIAYPKTMLVKFMGLYRVKVPRKRKMRKVHFVVMRSTFDTALPMHKKFDLKGSQIGREASESDKKKLFPVLKDKDLKKSGIRFFFQPERAEFLKQLESDCKLLTNLNMMDYSLLIGIFDKSRVDPQYGITEQTIREILNQDNCLHYTDRLDDHGLIYFMGIIDFLQHYNAIKKFETVAKGMVNDRTEISSVKPSYYARRLVKFIATFCAE
jgi:1-phosphatidylinositol-4-phosphate 5-kinase